MESLHETLPQAADISTREYTLPKIVAAEVRIDKKLDYFSAGLSVSFLLAPLMFMPARIICSITIAQARACQPQTIQSALLNKKHQNPIILRIFRCEPMSQAAITVTTIAGH